MFDGHVDHKTRKIEHGKIQENVRNVRVAILVQFESFRLIAHQELLAKKNDGYAKLNTRKIKHEKKIQSYVRM